MGWLDGAVAMITGGGSGLGHALVRRFVEEGARVAVLERDADKVAQLRQDFPSDVVAVEGDVSSLASNQQAVAAAVEAYGRLDTFVGNAGVWDGSVSIVDLPAEGLDAAFDTVFSVNVKGYLMGAKASYPELLKTHGNMIFTLSNAAFHTDGGGPLYTASKHAGLGLVSQLAFELAPKIRVNGVAPGPFNSDLRGPVSLGLDGASLTDGRTAEDIAPLLPLDYSPTAEDYTGMYVVLASNANSATTTGAVMQSDGGLRVRGIGRVSGGRHL
ncbi:3-(cis-5,6-dihydroxycyclohexa-1,3-dien-1-yl)propanoate dehydrogenase [Pseudonocardia bannensis]|uniref:3-(Cis-5,6-dihydroxycyclohexa-1, 3-dien-1-yl)propanoate dehydrogenase n=1 Tax=Pseudonocardia bannensis TaxID=630973 RepID=A0A848DFG5_9PSEU|nr:3-(cis-5,6-dihydroxycyclohexa-1,3-dien-1-yl)propanoate dehydrogenase [Pseudonocardia bannensis]NMH91390.1 3-(cis-5,6-dihydroxycyclohexa-1,3-dien-1-yl)propanoate dehydrogenase [Pseudonocardia bannensis]